jgi:hypothetical protein
MIEARHAVKTYTEITFFKIYHSPANTPIIQAGGDFNVFKKLLKCLESE